MSRLPSLYPTVIRTFQIDPLNLVAVPDAGGTSAIRRPPNGAAFRGRRGILTELLDELMPRREEARRAGDRVKSHAIKILMNSFYGVLGTPACRFYDPRLANAITGFGQELLLWCQARIEAGGRRVLYGDTDSLFVESGASDPQARAGAARVLARELNRDLAAHIERRWRVTSRLDLRSTGSTCGSSCPPCATAAAARASATSGCSTTGGARSFHGHGGRARRLDRAGREVQRELYARLFADQPVDEYLRGLVARPARRPARRRLVYRKSLRKAPAPTRPRPRRTWRPRASRTRRSARTHRLRHHHRRPRAGRRAPHPLDYEHYVQKQSARWRSRCWPCSAWTSRAWSATSASSRSSDGSRRRATMEPMSAPGLEALRDRAESPVADETEKSKAAETEGGREVLACAGCRRPITSGAARIQVGGSHAHSFVNPHGLEFRIGCFGLASGLLQIGDPETFWSWFPGYAWRSRRAPPAASTWGGSSARPTIASTGSSSTAWCPWRRGRDGIAPTDVGCAAVSATSAVVLLVVGFVASTINTLAGGGSFLTLPLLMFMGLPAAAANATNRLGVLAQNVGAVWGFHRYGVLDWRWALGAAVPTAAGSALGAWLALGIGDREFKRILAFLMIGICLWTLVDGSRPSKPAEGTLVHRPWLVRLGFFLAGIYGGFIQAGIGFLVLALTTLAGFDLVRGNAVKVLAVLLQTSRSPRGIPHRGAGAMGGRGVPGRGRPAGKPCGRAPHGPQGPPLAQDGGDRDDGPLRDPLALRVAVRPSRSGSSGSSGAAAGGSA